MTVAWTRMEVMEMVRRIMILSILKVEIIGFAGGLNVGYEKKTRIKNDTKVFGMNHRMEIVSILC